VLLAELHGKIIEEVQNSEDCPTSCVLVIYDIRIVLIFKNPLVRAATSSSPAKRRRIGDDRNIRQIL
jgi:hypothetical protein